MISGLKTNCGAGVSSLVIAFHLPFAGNDEEAAKRRRLAYEVMT